MKEKKESDYGTIQIKRNIKNQIVDFCDRNGYKISRYIENLFLQSVSGSTHRSTNK